ncbi:SLC13 family permease [Psychrosphaera sp. B3R10]|uniref:SLC13 family permease n=1 Tax=unclassified Psychrosphaera TaxID=2641570 RepID=UPI001C0A57B0|nr:MULTISPECIES: SLC13 family permease [unclassified Psychrosphaera]MBU2882285.1 SLC13 family permease [Psychrosphaera sp. I2R16]MBU2988966.1 SLC13 family permease [Psychrosphaera sp. B3R10]
MFDPKQSLTWIAPIVAVFTGVICFYLGLSQDIAITIGLTVWVGTWWIFECVPIPFTSLLPFVVLPTFNIIDYKQASSSFGNHVIILLLGAFLLAKGLESSQVHKRIAFKIINVIGGTSAFRIVFAFMCASAFLSMWMSNTATVLALMPVAAAVCAGSSNKVFSVALLLGLAYSASIGGVGTLIGTPPNVIFASVYEQYAGMEFNFVDWMAIGVPIVVVMIPLVALWLTHKIKLDHKIELPQMGQWSLAEKRALAIFSVVVCLWVFRKTPFGGWTAWSGIEGVGDVTIAMFGAIIMAIVKGDNDRPILTWETAKTIPWDMLILFSGGICLAKGFSASGLSELIGNSLSSALEMQIFLVMIVLCLTLSFLTEVTSNTATATLFMPILASVAFEKGIPIEYIMIPAVISCSFAFCLPVATAPNSVVFATGQVTVKDMAKQGVPLNIMGAFVISALCYLIL